MINEAFLSMQLTLDNWKINTLTHSHKHFLNEVKAFIPSLKENGQIEIYFKSSLEIFVGGHSIKFSEQHSFLTSSITHVNIEMLSDNKRLIQSIKSFDEMVYNRIDEEISEYTHVSAPELLIA